MTENVNTEKRNSQAERTDRVPKIPSIRHPVVKRKNLKDKYVLTDEGGDKGSRTPRITQDVWPWKNGRLTKRKRKTQNFR